MVDRDELDRLEQVFQDTLASDLPKPGDDMPSDDVWENLAGQISVTRRKNKIGVILPLILSLFVIGNIAYDHYSEDGGNVFTAIFKGKKIHSIKSHLHAKNDVEIDTETVTYIPGKPSEHEFWKGSPIVQSAMVMFITDDRLPFHFNNYGFDFPFQISQSSNKSSISKASSFLVLSDLPQVRINKLVPDEENAFVYEMVSSEAKPIIHVPKQLLTPIGHESIPQKKFEAKKPLILDNIGFSLATFSPRSQISDANLSVNHSTSYSFGGKAEFNVGKRLSVETGLGVQALKSSTQQTAFLTYDATKEKLVNGTTILVSSHQTNLASGYGTFDGQLNLSREVENLVTSNDLALNVDMAERVTELNVPVNLKFAAYENDNISINPIIGATTNIFIQDKASIKSVTSPDGIFNDNNSQILSSLNNNNPVTVDLTLGVDFNMPISANNELEVSPFYSRGLNSSVNQSIYSADNSLLGVAVGFNFKK